ncbi:MAG: c-type cytochrome domain-containing protein [Methanococcaceae archaeon]
MKKVYLLSLTAALLFLSLNCKDSISGDVVDSRTMPASDISFSKDLQPFLEIKCANGGCHDDGSRAGDLSLTSCTNAKADPSIIFPGNSATSRIVWAVQGLSGTEPMPPLGSTKPLTSEQVRGLKKWIDEGAKCN